MDFSNCDHAPCMPSRLRKEVPIHNIMQHEGVEEEVLEHV